MEFRTVLNISPSEKKIDHNHNFLLIGSCFSQNIGERLKQSKFKCLINPFGTIFNPVSISKVLTNACRNTKLNVNELIVSQGLYVHSDYHSQLSDINANVAIDQINEAISRTHNDLCNTDILIITLGTSIAYRSILTDEIVANCHKIPSSSFYKVDISIEENYDTLHKMIAEIKLLHPAIRVIFTISPVRHTKDGIIQNSRSKAKLIETIYRLQESDESLEYFPAFEWMMDDLRDYRFYEKDLVHPNEIAVDYIWEKFCTYYFGSKTNSINEEIKEINRSIGHRPLNPASDNHKTFILQLIDKIEKIKQSFPFLDFDQELLTLRGLSQK